MTLVPTSALNPEKIVKRWSDNRLVAHEVDQDAKSKAPRAKVSCMAARCKCKKEGGEGRERKEQADGKVAPRCRAACVGMIPKKNKKREKKSYSTVDTIIQ